MPLLVLIMLMAFLARRSITGPGFSPDGWHYLIAARNLAHGYWGEVTCDPAFAHYFDSFYTVLIALFSGLSQAGLSLFVSGKFVSAAMGSLCALPIYWIALREFGRKRVAWIAAALVAVMPHLVRMGSFVLSDTTYTFFQLMGFYFALRAVNGNSEESLAGEPPPALMSGRASSLRSLLSKEALAAGAMWGLASLSRTNGIFSILIFCAYLGFRVLRSPTRTGKRKFLAIGVCASLAWGVFYAPHVAYLSYYFGKPTLSGKNPGLLSVRGKDAGQPPRPGTGSDLDAEELARNQGKGPSGVLNYYLAFPKTARRVTWTGLRRGHFDDTLRNYRFPEVLPILAALAFLVIIWGNRVGGGWRKWLSLPEVKQTALPGLFLAWALGYYLIDAAVLQMFERHYQFIYCLLCVFAALGMETFLGLRVLAFRPVQAVLVGALLWSVGGQLIPEFGRPETPGTLSAAPPIFQGDSDFKRTLYGTHHSISDSLLLGVSACVDYVPVSEDRSFKDFSRVLGGYLPDLLICELSENGQRACGSLLSGGSYQPLQKIEGYGQLYSSVGTLGLKKVNDHE